MHDKKKNQGSGIRTKKNKNRNLAMILLLVSCLYSLSSNAQCAMCRAVLETEEGGVKPESVNDGIIYLMAFPYLLVGILSYVIYKVYSKKKQ
jgi:hypothetical protein